MRPEDLLSPTGPGPVEPRSVPQEDLAVKNNRQQIIPPRATVPTVQEERAHHYDGGDNGGDQRDGNANGKGDTGKKKRSQDKSRHKKKKDNGFLTKEQKIAILDKMRKRKDKGVGAAATANKEVVPLSSSSSSAAAAAAAAACVASPSAAAKDVVPPSSASSTAASVAPPPSSSTAANSVESPPSSATAAAASLAPSAAVVTSATGVSPPPSSATDVAPSQPQTNPKKLTPMDTSEPLKVKDELISTETDIVVMAVTKPSDDDNNCEIITISSDDSDVEEIPLQHTCAHRMQHTCQQYRNQGASVETNNMQLQHRPGDNSNIQHHHHPQPQHQYHHHPHLPGGNVEMVMWNPPGQMGVQQVHNHTVQPHDPQSQPQIWPQLESQLQSQPQLQTQPQHQLEYQHQLQQHHQHQHQQQDLVTPQIVNVTSLQNSAIPSGAEHQFQAVQEDHDVSSRNIAQPHTCAQHMQQEQPCEQTTSDLPVTAPSSSSYEEDNMQSRVHTCQTEQQQEPEAMEQEHHPRVSARQEELQGGLRNQGKSEEELRAEALSRKYYVKMTSKQMYYCKYCLQRFPDRHVWKRHRFLLCPVSKKRRPGHLENGEVAPAPKRIKLAASEVLHRQQSRELTETESEDRQQQKELRMEESGRSTSREKGVKKKKKKKKKMRLKDFILTASSNLGPNNDSDVPSASSAGEESEPSTSRENGLTKRKKMRKKDFILTAPITSGPNHDSSDVPSASSAGEESEPSTSMQNVSTKEKKKMRKKDFILTAPITSGPNHDSSDVPSATSAGEEREPSTSRENVVTKAKTKKMRKKDFILTGPNQLDVPSISSAGEENEQSISYGNDNSNPPVLHQSTDSKKKKVKKMRKSDFVVKEKGAAKKNSSDRKRHVSSSSNSNDAKRHKVSADEPSSVNTKSTGQKPVSDDHAKRSEKSTKEQNLSSDNARNSNASSKKATNATAFENFLSAFDTATVKKAPKVAKKSTSKPSRKSVSKTSSSSKDSVSKTSSSFKDSIAKKSTSSSSASKTPASSKDSMKESSSSSKIMSKSSLSKVPKASTKHSNSSTSRSDAGHPASSGTGHKVSSSKNSAKSKDKLMAKEKSHAVIAQHTQSGSPAKSPSSLEPNNRGNGGKNQPSKLPEETPSSSSANKNSGSKKLTPSETSHLPSSNKSTDDSKCGKKLSASSTAVQQSSSNILKEPHSFTGSSNKKSAESEQNSQPSSQKVKTTKSSPEEQKTSKKCLGESSTLKRKDKKQGDKTGQGALKEKVPKSKSSTAHDMPFGPRNPASSDTNVDKDKGLSCSSSPEHSKTPVARETSISKHKHDKKGGQTHPVASKETVPKSKSSATPFGPRKPKASDTNASKDKDLSCPSLTEHAKPPKETSTSSNHNYSKQGDLTHKIASKETSSATQSMPFGPRKKLEAAAPEKLSSSAKIQQKGEHRHPKKLTPIVQPKKLTPIPSANVKSSNLQTKKNVVARPLSDSISSKKQIPSTPKKLTLAKCGHSGTSSHNENGGKPVTSHEATSSSIASSPHAQANTKNPTEESSTSNLPVCPVTDTMTETESKEQSKDTTPGASDHSVMENTPAQTTKADTQGDDVRLPTKELSEGPSGENEGQQQVDDESEVFDRPSTSNSLPTVTKNDVYSYLGKVCAQESTSVASVDSVNENVTSRTISTATADGDAEIHDGHLAAGPSGEHSLEQQMDDEQTIEQMNDDSGDSNGTASTSLPTVSKDDVYSYLGKVCAQYNIPQDSPSGSASNNQDSQPSNSQESSSINQEDEAGNPMQQVSAQSDNSKEVIDETRNRPGTPTEDEHTQDSGAQTPQLQSSPMWQKVHSYIDNNGITRIKISRKSTESEAEVDGAHESIEEAADEEPGQEQQEHSSSGLASSNEAPAVGASVFNVKSKKKLANILERVKRRPSSDGQKNSKPDKETDPAENRNATASTSEQHGHEMVTAEDTSARVPDGSKKSNESTRMSGSGGEPSDSKKSNESTRMSGSGGEPSERTHISENRCEVTESIHKPDGINSSNLPTEGSENHGTVSDVADDLNMSRSSSLNISRVSSCSVSSEHQHDVDLNRMTDDIDEEVFQQPRADERPDDASPPDDARPGDDVLGAHIKGTKSFLDSALRQWMPTLLESSAQPSAPRSSESTDRRKKEEFQKFKRMHLENMKKQKSPQKRTEAVDGATSRPSTSAGRPTPSSGQEKESNKGAASAKAREPEYYWCETCHHVYETRGAFYSSKHPCRFQNPTFKMMPKSKVDAQLKTKRRLHQQRLERQRSSNPTDPRMTRIQPVQRTNSMPAAVDGSVRPSSISQDHRSRMEQAFPDNRQRHSSGEGRHQGTPAMHVNRRRHSSEERRHHESMTHHEITDRQTHSRDPRHPNHGAHHRARHNSSHGKDRSGHDRVHHTSSGHSARPHKPTDRSRPQINQDHPSRSGASSFSIGYDIEAGDPMGLISLPSPAPAPPKEIRGPDSPINLIHVPSPAPCTPTNERESTAPEQNLVISHPRPMQQQATPTSEPQAGDKQKEPEEVADTRKGNHPQNKSGEDSQALAAPSETPAISSNGSSEIAAATSTPTSATTSTSPSPATAIEAATAGAAAFSSMSLAGLSNIEKAKAAMLELDRIKKALAKRVMDEERRQRLDGSSSSQECSAQNSHTPHEDGASTSAVGLQDGSGNASQNETSHDDKPEENWVQCDACTKWRKLPPDVSIDEVMSAEKWFCKMNPDESHNRCEIPEESYDKDEECVYSDRGQRAEFGRLGRSPNMKRKGGKRKRGRQRKTLPSALVASHSITSTSEDAPSRVDTTSISEVATCTSVSQAVSSAATTASTPIVSTNAGMPSTTTCTVASAMLASPCVSSQVVRTMASAGVSSTLPRVSPQVIASGASQLVPTTSGTGASIPATSTNTIGDSTHSASATPSPHVSPEVVTSGASQVVPLLSGTAASIPATSTSTTAASTHATASSSLGSPQVIASVASEVVPTTSQTVSSVPAISTSSIAASTCATSSSSRVSPQVIASDVTQVDSLTSLTRMTAASIPATCANTIAASTHPASATSSPLVSPQVIASVASQVDPITSVTRMTAASVPATSANTIAAGTHVTLSLPPVPPLVTASGASNVSSSTLHSPPVASVARASRGPPVPGVPITSTCTIAEGQVRRHLGATASRISPTNTTVPLSQNAGIAVPCTFPQGQMHRSNQTLQRNAGMHSTHQVAQRNPAAVTIHVPQQVNPPPYPNHGLGQTRNVNYRQQIDARERTIEVQKKRIQDLINSSHDVSLDSTERFQRIYEANTMLSQFERESQKLQQLRQLALQQECAQGMGQQYLHSPGSQSGQQNAGQCYQQNQQQQAPINTASNGHMMQASPSHLVPSNQQMPTNPIPVQSNTFYQQSTIPHQQQVTSQQQQLTLQQLTSQQRQLTSQQQQVTSQQHQVTSQQHQVTLQQRQSTSQQQQLTLQQHQVVLQQQRYQQQQTQGLQRGRQLQTQAEAGQLQSQHRQQQRHAFQLQQQMQTSDQMLRGQQGTNPQPAQGTVQQSRQQYRVPEGGQQQRVQQPAQPYRIQQAVQQPVHWHRAQQNVNQQQSVQQISQHQRLQPNQQRGAQQNVNQQPSVQGQSIPQQIAQHQRLHQPAQHHGVQQSSNPQRSQEAQQQRHQETQSLHQQHQQQYQIYTAQQLNPTQNRSQPSPNQESSGRREPTEISPEESYLMNLYKHLDPKFEPFRQFLCKIRCKLFGTWAIGRPGASRADLSTFHEEYEYLQNIENRLSKAGHPTERLVCSIRVKLHEDHVRRIGSSNNEGQEQHAIPHDVSNDAEEYWDSIVRDSAQDLVREAREAMSAEQNPATNDAQRESPKETERVDSTAPEVQTPTPEVQTPTPEVQTPTPEVQTPIPEVQTPTPEVQTPTPEVQTPTSEVQTPIPEVQTPAPEAQDDFAQDASSAVRRAVLNQQTPGFRQPTPAPCRTPDTVTSQPSRDPSPAARQTPSPQETRNETLRLLKFCEQLIGVLGQKRMSPSVAARLCIWKRRYIDIKSQFENQGSQSQPREEYVCWLMLQILAKEMRIMSLNNKIRARQIKLQNLSGPDADREREELQNIIGQKFIDEQRLKENQKYYDYLQNHPEVQNPFQASVMPNVENVANRELRDEMIRSNPSLSNLLSGPLMTQSTFQGQSGSGSGLQGQPGADSRSQPGPGQSSNSSYSEAGPSGFGSSSQGQSDSRSDSHLQPSRESVSQAHFTSGSSRIKQEPRDQEPPAPIQEPPQMAPVPVPTSGQSVSSTNCAQYAKPCNQPMDQPCMPGTRSNQSNVSETARSRPGELAIVQTDREESMSRNIDNNASHVDNFVTKNHSTERSSCRFVQSHSTTNPDEGASSIHDTEPSSSATSDSETTAATRDQVLDAATGVLRGAGTEQQMVQETDTPEEQITHDLPSESDQTTSSSAVDKEVATAMASNLPRYPEFSDISDADDRATPDNVSGTPAVSSESRPDEPTDVGTEQREVMSRINESLESYLENVVKKNDDLERSSCRFAQSQATPRPSADASSIHAAETSCPATSDGETTAAPSDQPSSAAAAVQSVAGTEQQMSQETEEQITPEQDDLPSESDQATSSSAVDVEVATAMASNLPIYPEFSDISDADDRATPDIVSETPAIFNEANSRSDGPANDQTGPSQSTTSPSADAASVHDAETSCSATCDNESNRVVRNESSSDATGVQSIAVTEQHMAEETGISEEPATQDNNDIPPENDHETSKTTVGSEVPNSGDVPSEINRAVSNADEESDIPTTTTSNQSSIPENNNATSDIAVESEVPDTGDVSSKSNQTSSNGAAENEVALNVPGYSELSENNNAMSHTAVDNEIPDSGDVPSENNQTTSNTATENQVPITAASYVPISPELSENNDLMSNSTGENEIPDSGDVPSAENNQTSSNTAAGKEVPTTAASSVPISPDLSENNVMSNTAVENDVSDSGDVPLAENSQTTSNVTAENEVPIASSLNVPIYPELSDISDVDDRATPDLPNSSATQNTLPTAVARRLSTAEYSPISDAADETDDELNNNQVDDAVQEEQSTNAPSEEPIDDVSESPDADQSSQQAPLDFPVPPDAQTDARSEVPSDDVPEKPAGDQLELPSTSQDPSQDHPVLPDLATEEPATNAPSEVPSDDVSEMHACDQLELPSTSRQPSLDHPVLPDLLTVKEELASHNQIAVPRRTSIDVDALSDISDYSSDLEIVAFLPSPEVSNNSNNRRVSSKSNSNPTLNTSDETETPKATPAAGLSHQEPQWPEVNLPILQHMISQPSPIGGEPQTHEVYPSTLQNVIPQQAAIQTNSSLGLSLSNVARTQQTAIALQPTKDLNLNVIPQQAPQTNSSHVQPGPSVSNVARTQNTAIALQPRKDLNLKQLNVVWAPNQWRKPSGSEHTVVSCDPVPSDHPGSFSTVVSQSQQAPAMNVISVPSQQSRQLPLLRPAPHLQQRYPSGHSQDGSLSTVQLQQYAMPTTAIIQAPLVNTNLPNSMSLPTLVAAPSIANLQNQVVGASSTGVLDARTTCSAHVVEQNNLDSAVSGVASTSEPEQQLPIFVCVQSLNTNVMAAINQ